MDRRHDRAPARQRRLAIEMGDIARIMGDRMPNRRAFGDDKARTARRAPRIIIVDCPVQHAIGGELSRHRRHDDAIAQPHRLAGEGREQRGQVGDVGHAHSSKLLGNSSAWVAKWLGIRLVLIGATWCSRVSPRLAKLALHIIFLGEINAAMRLDALVVGRIAARPRRQHVGHARLVPHGSPTSNIAAANASCSVTPTACHRHSPGNVATNWHAVSDFGIIFARHHFAVPALASSA